MKAETIESTGETHQGRKRENNEDCWLQLPEQGVFCVADGMGGTAGGELASKAVVTSLEKLIGKTPPATQMSQRERVALVRRAVNEASQWIKTFSNERGIGLMGSTVVALALPPQCPRRATALHAGDSRLYRYRQGELVLCTKDHNMAADLAGELGRDPASIPSRYRNELTRAVGLKEEVELDATPLDLQAGDLLLLCSDGLSGMLDDSKLSSLLNSISQEPLDQVAAKLIAGANEAGGRDNITVILVRIRDLGDERDDEPDTPVLPAEAPDDEARTVTQVREEPVEADTPTTRGADTPDTKDDKPAGREREPSFDTKTQIVPPGPIKPPEETSSSSAQITPPPEKAAPRPTDGAAPANDAAVTSPAAGDKIETDGSVAGRAEVKDHAQAADVGRKSELLPSLASVSSAAEKKRRRVQQKAASAVVMVLALVAFLGRGTIKSWFPVSDAKTDMVSASMLAAATDSLAKATEALHQANLTLADQELSKTERQLGTLPRSVSEALKGRTQALRKQWDDAQSAAKAVDLTCGTAMLEASNALALAETAMLGTNWEVALVQLKLGLSRTAEVQAKRDTAEAATLKDLLAKRVETVEREQRNINECARLVADGQEALVVGHYDVAVKHAEAALKLRPQDGVAQRILAESQAAAKAAEAYVVAMTATRVALGKEDWDEAERQAKVALGIKAEDTDAKSLAAAAQQGRSNISEYVRFLKLGRKALQDEAWDEAEQWGKMALRLRPKDTEAMDLVSGAQTGRSNQAECSRLLRVGEQELSAERYDAAIGRAESALRMRPNDGAARKLLTAAQTAWQNNEAYAAAMTGASTALAHATALQASNANLALADLKEALGLVVEAEKRKPTAAVAELRAQILARERSVKGTLLPAAEKTMSPTNSPPIPSPDSSAEFQRNEAEYELLLVKVGVMGEPTEKDKYLTTDEARRASPLWPIPDGKGQADYLRRLNRLHDYFNQNGLLEDSRKRGAYLRKAKDNIERW